jgi:hypothetical protein
MRGEKETGQLPIFHLIGDTAFRFVENAELNPYILIALVS